MSPPPNPTVSKTLGALLGVHTGDSLGATLEFMSWREIRAQYPHGHRDIIGRGSFDWPAGHATDDTDMTRAVLLAYHALERHNQDPTPGKVDYDIARAAADWSLKWFLGDWPGRNKGSWPRDMGNATRVGLSNYQLSLNPTTCGAGQGSAGNGSLMRCIATGLFARSKEQRRKESVAISMFTHNDARCTVACAAYNEMVAALVEGKTVEEALERGEEVAEDLDAPAVTAAIRRGKELSISTLAAQGPGPDMPDHTSGYVLQSLKVAVAALRDPRSFEDVLVDVVAIGGDTDTNGAIAGGLLGARDGIEKIPEGWLETLQFRDEFEKLGREILTMQGFTST
ncbi:ADP-ribosylglycohydrolase family protein [Amniculicola lignicola CBS 123094]|uniref:ADP-ribosylhydrolase ARH3 n=1 Tax=Amniculicola lignicola CBS 123094 TaxID=1392246 RepID=A0A6A5X3V1_9PLEO|nr:ADP-ribosylglycohydrolase family protein [Amniculicola lignicola CBS 123094]